MHFILNRRIYIFIILEDLEYEIGEIFRFVFDLKFDSSFFT